MPHLRALCVFSLFAVLIPSADAQSRRRKPAVQYTAEAVNNAALQDVITGNMVGPAVLRAQILLDRANFSVGQIDGATGDNFRRAVSGFRVSRKLSADPVIDDAAWQALNVDAAPALTQYTITAEDTKGPFIKKIPRDMMEQAKLESLGYADVMEALGEKFHCSPKMLTRLNPGAKFEAGQEIVVPNVATTIPVKAGSVVVSKSKVTVEVLDPAGNLIAQYPATIGSEHDPLPVGEWKITGVAKNPVFHYNPKLFWDADPTHSKAKIPAGPNNPVGMVWIDLSKEHYGIHGTPEPSRIGYSQSHGCIRLTNWDALELAELVKPGIPAILKE